MTTTSASTSPLGIIGGSSFLESQYLSDFKDVTLTSDYGTIKAKVNTNKTIYFVQRHGALAEHEYCPPHLIPHKAIIAGLYSVGVQRIIGFGSVGSLKHVLPVGSLVLPDDFYNPIFPISFFEYSKQGHVVPGLSLDLRTQLSQTLTQAQITHVKQGTYAQTHGPRFETPAEVRQLAQWADVVGMTCAHEATLCKELNISYALICMVDNMGNGLADRLLTPEDFHTGVRRNLQTMETVLGVVVQQIGGQHQKQ